MRRRAKPTSAALSAAVAPHLSVSAGAVQALAEGDGPARVNLYGEVGWEITARGVAQALAPLAERDLDVRLNSYGGDVFDGIAAFNMLAGHDGDVRITVEGVAASAASVIAMAGDELVLGEGAFLMVHNPWGLTVGDHRAHEEQAGVLAQVRDAIAGIYAKRSGAKEADVLAMMAAETWLDGPAAVEAGFADETLSAEAHAPKADARAAAIFARYRNAPAPLRAAVASTAAPSAQPGDDPTMRYRPGRGGVAAHEAPDANRGGAAPAPQQQSPAPAAPQALTQPNPVPPVPAPSPAIPTEQNTPSPGPVVPNSPAQPRAASLAELRGIAAQTGGRLGGDWIVAQMEGNATRDAAMSDALTVLAAAQPNSPARAQITRDERDTFRASLETAILMRSGYRPPQGQPALDASLAGEHRGSTLMEMGKAAIRAAGGRVQSLGGDPLAIAGAALSGDGGLFNNYRASAGMHTTSDLPVALGGAARRTLMAAYDQYPQTWRQLVRTGNAPDFRDMHRFALTGTGKLLLVPEHGEYKHTTISEMAEKFAIQTFGRKTAVTRQAIINDDMGVVAAFPRLLGEQAAILYADLVWGLILRGHTNEVKLSDGKPLFHADHGNVGTPAPVNEASFEEMFVKFQSHTQGEGEFKTHIYAQPRYLLHGPLISRQVDTFLSTRVFLETGQINVGAYKGVTPVMEPRIQGKTWFGLGDPNAVPTIEIAFLNGSEQPETFTREGWDVDGLEIKCRTDVGVTPLSAVGFYRNAGQ